MSTYKFTPQAVASPHAPQKPLVRKRAHSGGAQWVRVQRHEPGSQAKKPCTFAHSHLPVDQTATCGPTTDDLWAMLLNTGWVPVKEHRLQDWKKLKKSTNGAMYVPMGSQPYLKKAMQMTMMILNKPDETLQCMFVFRPMCSSVLRNVSTYPPPPQTHTFLKRPFLTDFKNIHIPPPPGDMLAHRSKTCKESKKVTKRTKLAG